MFEPFQKFLVGAAGSWNIQKEVQAASICQCFRNILCNHLEQTAEEYVKAGHFRQGVFVVKVANSGWAQEIIIRKEKIIAEMNEKLGQKVVINLRTELM